LQYYQATSNGAVNETVIGNIAAMLAASQKQADFIGSLVTDTNPNRPTEWVDTQNDGYSFAVQFLKDAFGSNWEGYLKKFKEEKFDDEALNAVERQEDLSDVLPKAEDQRKLFAYIKQSKQLE